MVGFYLSPYVWMFDIKNLLNPSDVFYYKRKSLYYLGEYERALKNHNYLESQKLHDKMQEMHRLLCKLLQEEVENLFKKTQLGLRFFLL